MIDTSTTKWLEPPQDIRKNVLCITKNKNRMLLDDVYFKDKKILTGVQFYMQNGIIRTAIIGRRYFKINVKTLSWQIPPFVDIGSAKDKTPGFHQHSYEYTQTFNQTVKFERSSFKYDMGQSLVPYFGTYDITIDPPQILQGIGFMHITNHKTYAGVIIPFVRTLSSYSLNNTGVK